MSYGEEKNPWSVFDGVKTISVAPEPLMADISAAIAALEYARASSFSHSPIKSGSNKKRNCEYDGRMADEAYKAGLVCMAAGRVDEAVVSLNVALSNCPPANTSAVVKLQSVISGTSQPHKKSSNYSN